MTPDEPSNFSTSDSHCRRCGICCTKGGPAIHLEDRPLVEKGFIPAKHLTTIRKGEPVRDNVRGGVFPAPCELIKIKGSQDKWTCVFFDEGENGCRIYQCRPLECRTLKCWDTRDILTCYDKNRLARKDFLAGVEGLWDLIKDHEARCAYNRIRPLVNAAAGENRMKAADEILEMVKYDKHLRLLVTEKAGMDPEMTDFFFGRPLTETLQLFGVTVSKVDEKVVLKF